MFQIGDKITIIPHSFTHLGVTVTQERKRYGRFVKYDKFGNVVYTDPETEQKRCVKAEFVK